MELKFIESNDEKITARVLGLSGGGGPKSCAGPAREWLTKPGQDRVASSPWTGQ